MYNTRGLLSFRLYVWPSFVTNIKGYKVSETEFISVLR
jgi:hypothetical protein